MAETHPLKHAGPFWSENLTPLQTRVLGVVMFRRYSSLRDIRKELKQRITVEGARSICRKLQKLGLISWDLDRTGRGAVRTIHATCRFIPVADLAGAQPLAAPAARG